MSSQNKAVNIPAATAIAVLEAMLSTQVIGNRLFVIDSEGNPVFAVSTSETTENLAIVLESE